MSDITPIERLRSIMAALRHPETGCAWDIEQTFATIAPYTIEEAYEVADAIARDDLVDLKEELGDLLLQVMFHARMAEEAAKFSFDDVANIISDKLIRRHPHVFSEDKETDHGALRARWEELKSAERVAKAKSGVLADIPLALPALTRAEKLGKRASAVGFDWPDMRPVIAKIREELDELEAEIEANDQAAMAEEMGDLLFACVNLARKLHVDPESALRTTNIKFERRFNYIERSLQASNKEISATSLDEMEALWLEAKAQESS